VVFIEERVGDIPAESSRERERANDAGFRPTVNRFAVKYFETSARSRPERQEIHERRRRRKGTRRRSKGKKRG